jgi:hypothetical protein
MSKVDITAPGKLLALCLIIVGCMSYIIITVISGKGDVTPAWATLTLITGYLIGNGVGAARGAASTPVFTSADTDDDSEASS